MARSLLSKLAGGDRRSIGRANDVVRDVLARPALFGSLFAGLSVNDPVVRGRAADAVEKISADRPECLRPYRSQLLELARSDQKEVRWHIAQMLPRLRWNRREQRHVYRLLVGYLGDSSSLVKTFALQALVDLSRQAPTLRHAVLRTVKQLTTRGTPAMRARGRKLLAVMDQTNTRSSTARDGTRRPAGARGRRSPDTAS